MLAWCQGVRERGREQSPAPYLQPVGYNYVMQRPSRRGRPLLRLECRRCGQDFFLRLKEKKVSVLASAMDGENIFDWQGQKASGIKALCNRQRIQGNKVTKFERWALVLYPYPL